MNRRIEIEQIEPEGGTTQGCNLETIDGGDAQLEGWLQALVQRTGVEGSAAQLWALSADAQPGHGDDLHQAAADLSIKLAGEGATPMAVAAGWAAIRDVATFHGAPGDVWRVSVKPSDGPEVAARAGAEAVQYDWGGGLVWLRVAEGTDLRARLGDLPGHATLVRASAGTRARLVPFPPEPAPVAALSSALRAKFDPRGILNPGLMAP